MQLAALVLLVGLAAVGAQEALPEPEGWPAPSGVEPPGPAYRPALSPAAPAEGAPRWFEATPDAGPDETFLATGERLTEKLAAWGAAADPVGRAWPLKVQLATPDYLAATVPEAAADGPLLVWAGNDTGWSRPLRLNTPQLWWCLPSRAVAGGRVRLFGRDLVRRPDGTVAYVWLARGDGGRWLTVTRAAKYELEVALPGELAAGEYQLWVHAGRAGAWGWSEPLPLQLTAPPAPGKVAALPAGGDVQAAVNQLGAGTLTLAPGTYPLAGTLVIPAGVTVRGAGREATRLELQHAAGARFAATATGGWNQAPGRVHTVGDTITWRLNAPAGRYQVWLRYATDMAPWGQPGVSGAMSLRVDQGAPVSLENLPNTGGFGTFRWARSAELDVPAGAATLVWRNEKGGGISLDALVLAAREDYQPGEQPFPEPGPGLVVIQAELPEAFVTREGVLPGGERAVVWLAGDGAGIENVTVAGTPQSNTGVLIRARDGGWVAACRLRDCRVADLDGKEGANRAVHLVFAHGAEVRSNELWGRAPLFLSGLKQSVLADNRLVSATRYGGNAEAAIEGRNEVIEECLIEGNVAAAPPAASAGGPTARRLIWVSTGRGSITRNAFLRNRSSESDRPLQFGGVAGTDNNVGEMILFEGNHRTMFFGALAAGGSQSVTLPPTLPATPEARLGNVKREQLAHDEAGQEAPYWPQEAWDESPEPPLGEYYVSVFAGAGRGQTRRVVGRDGATLRLDRPWRSPPAAGSLVAVGTAFYQNLIGENRVTDGMTGIQLWISCLENVAYGNTILRQRRPAFYLYGNATTLASSMPRTWNRGVSPLFFNQIEANVGEECSSGVLLVNGDAGNLPIEFPRALGNVIRHNTFYRSRGDGVVLTSGKGPAAASEPAASVLGTVVELNLVRDALVAYHAAHGADGTVFRRNQAYFWYPVSLSGEPPVAFAIDRPGAGSAVADNRVEGKSGELKPAGVVELRGPGS